MAVFTHVGAEEIADFLTRYNIAPLTSAKGIAEGVENSNYMVEAGGSRYILTLYEKRVDVADLPFFISYIDHLAKAGNPVPRMLPDVKGVHVQQLAGRPACLIQFLSGVSVSHPTAGQAQAAGSALARLHVSGSSFADGPANPQGPGAWRAMIDRMGERFDSIQPGLAATVETEWQTLAAQWPTNLPTGPIHADLFPDNVLMLDDQVTGIIDFYFACRDITIYDYAITHGAWCFESDGSGPNLDLARALARGYQSVRPISAAERAALPILARGSALRFLLTRAVDWIETPPDALVVRKDPLAYLRRLETYRNDPDGTVFAL